MITMDEHWAAARSHAWAQCILLFALGALGAVMAVLDPEIVFIWYLAGGVSAVALAYLFIAVRLRAPGAWLAIVALLLAAGHGFAILAALVSDLLWGGRDVVIVILSAVWLLVIGRFALHVLRGWSSAQRRGFEVIPRCRDVG